MSERLIVGLPLELIMSLMQSVEVKQGFRLGFAGCGARRGGVDFFCSIAGELARVIVLDIPAEEGIFC